jgi:hypothetical protein
MDAAIVLRTSVDMLKKRNIFALAENLTSASELADTFTDFSVLVHNYMCDECILMLSVGMSQRH